MGDINISEKRGTRMNKPIKRYNKIHKNPFSKNT